MKRGLELLAALGAWVLGLCREAGGMTLLCAYIGWSLVRGRMDGRELFKFAVTKLPETTQCADTTALMSPVEQPAVCHCGKVTAQPRYIVFDMVWGRLNAVRRKGIAGVFCRSCADRAAIRASLICWLVDCAMTSPFLMRKICAV